MTTFTLEEMKMLLNKGVRCLFIGSHKINVLLSATIKTFYQNGFNCCGCGLEANYFSVEKYKDTKTYHIAVYHKNKTEQIRFTKDHIKPLSKGGKDTHDNLQTMCYNCNQLKGNK
jgi:hypothetical protein